MNNIPTLITHRNISVRLLQLTCFCVWALDLCECVCVLTALSLLFFNYSPPQTVPSQISILFPCSNSFLSVFLLLFQSPLITALRLSYNSVYLCDSPHYCRGLPLFERASVSLYNILNGCSLWLHDLFCASWNLGIKELWGRVKQKLRITLCLELAVVQALSQMNDH